MTSVPALPFRSRLFRALLPTFLGTILFIFILTAGSIVATFHFSDRRILEDELSEISGAVMFQNKIVPPRYHWSEPHHTHIHPRLNPQFVQLFDPNGKLLFASENIGQLKGYPSSLKQRDGFFTDKHSGHTILFLSKSITNNKGNTLGYIQIGQFEIDRSPLYGLGVVVLALVVLVAMLLWWFLLQNLALRVTKPLEFISDAAQKISLHTREYRIPPIPDADIETHQLAEALNSLLVRLQNNFDEMKAFTAHAAHELQTPITALLGSAEVALRRERTPEAYQETLHNLHGELKSMRDVVKSLLELARLEHVDTSSKTEISDFSRLVLETALDHQPKFSQKNLILKTDIQPDVQLTGNREQLKRLIENILDNAHKYTQTGGTEIILIDNPPTFTVQDTGLGIQQEDLAKVGTRFFRAKEMTAHGISGSGLGMALVKEIAQKHHAQVIITSQPNHGTKVVVRFEMV